MDEGRFQTVYEAVQSLHSNWLAVRGPTSLDTVKSPNTGAPKSTIVRVYMDNVFMGDTSKLREIAVKTVMWVRHYDGVAATGRWGLDHGAGVIYVSTHDAGIDLPGRSSP